MCAHVQRQACVPEVHRCHVRSGASGPSMRRARARVVQTTDNSDNRLCRDLRTYPRGHNDVLAPLHLPFCDTTHTRSHTRCKPRVRLRVERHGHRSQKRRYIRLTGMKRVCMSARAICVAA